MNKLRIIISLLIIAFIAQACSPKKTPNKIELDNTGQANIHAISDQQLRSVMKKLKSLTFSRYDSELERDKQRTRYVRQITDIAHAVESSSESIIAIGQRLELDEGERKIFLSFAAKLTKQASGLKILADSGEEKLIRIKMQNLVNTCNSCHDNFRVMTEGK